MKHYITSFFALDLIGITQKIKALKIFLLLSIVTLLSFSVINVLYYQLYKLSLFEFVFMLIAIFLYHQADRSDHYQKIVYTAILLAAFMLLAIILLFDTEMIVVMWAAIFPIAAFYLLGSRVGSVVHAIFSLILFFAFYFRVPSSHPITSMTLMNLGGALTAIGIFGYLYEYTKNKALYDAYMYSFVDELTKIGNRKMFSVTLHKKRLLLKREHRPFSLIMTDIDHFKSINDRYGHLDGDQVLIEFTELLQGKIQSDELLFRWGGEEFVIILPDKEMAYAAELAEKLRLSIQEHTFKKVGKLTSSFGVTEAKPNETDEACIRRLDKALYQAKNLGRNCVEVLL